MNQIFVIIFVLPSLTECDIFKWLFYGSFDSEAIKPSNSIVTLSLSLFQKNTLQKIQIIQKISKFVHLWNTVAYLQGLFIAWLYYIKYYIALFRQFSAYIFWNYTPIQLYRKHKKTRTIPTYRVLPYSLIKRLLTLSH